MRLPRSLSSLGKAVGCLIVLPFDVAADVVTLGGAMNERRSTYTGSRLRDAMEHVDQALRPENGGRR